MQIRRVAVIPPKRESTADPLVKKHLGARQWKS